MTKKILLSLPKLFGFLFIILAFNSCKKDKTTTPQKPTVNPVTLGLYEYASGVNKRIFLPVTQVGTKAVTYYTVFDTGSSGMTLDADGILPASMITSSGIQVTGDSVVVNGITVTKTTGIISFGDNLSGTKEYGNLAYANITIGDQLGNLSLKRVPFFLYYKIVDNNNNKFPAHSSDVFGVGPGTSYVISQIQSPLQYFETGSNLTGGFKLATLNKSMFSTAGNYVSNLLTIGLTNTDLSSSGFIMHGLSRFNVGGYSPNIPATISYSGKTIAATVLFDTGTPSTTVIEDKLATTAIGNLPANSTVTVTTNQGFVYTYTTTSTSNLTEVQNPANTGDSRTIFSLDFFISNEYLTDYGNHRIGLKNN
ncbi:hypothetical protein [Mucilaginibacter celer]|uniref:Peptidase A1 domain-containing protein n=1 Tax=Mucilaginibacter celer TaxID=2305508 RepID=A0A494VLP5_9SPHI|nr:hypothetical protein [Mucilaginibacter celer]AYL96187.1 hypothetical protein HYN43_013190 [Mucilaginibacter celer]